MGGGRKEMGETRGGGGALVELECGRRKHFLPLACQIFMHHL